MYTLVLVVKSVFFAMQAISSGPRAAGCKRGLLCMGVAAAVLHTGPTPRGLCHTGLTFQHPHILLHDPQDSVKPCLFAANYLLAVLV